MSGFTLDAGALIAIERANREVAVILREALRDRLPLAVPAGALAQVWRDGQRQARLARLVAADVVEIVPLDDGVARASGQLCGRTRTSDVIDASVVLCARARKHRVLTSDPHDLRRLDPRLELVVI